MRLKEGIQLSWSGIGFGVITKFRTFRSGLGQDDRCGNTIHSRLSRLYMVIIPIYREWQNHQTHILYLCQFGTDLNFFLPILSSHRMDHFDQRNKRLRENRMSCLGCTKADPRHSQTEAVPSRGCEQYVFLLYLQLRIISKSTRGTSVCLTPANLPFEGYSQYPNNRISI